MNLGKKRVFERHRTRLTTVVYVRRVRISTPGGGSKPQPKLRPARWRVPSSTKPETPAPSDRISEARFEYVQVLIPQVKIPVVAAAERCSACASQQQNTTNRFLAEPREVSPDVPRMSSFLGNFS